MTDIVLDPRTNPQAQKLLDAALAEPAPAAAQNPAVKAELKPPPETRVELPGGGVWHDGAWLNVAEVRELTGEDEEVIAKSSTVGKAMMLILNRATVSFGSEGELKATPEIVDSLLSGDREALLLAIRRVTYGDVDDFEVGCGDCGGVSKVDIDLDADVPAKKLDNPSDRTFTVELRKGREAEVNLPDGITQKKLATLVSSSTVAEMNTVLIAGCLVSVDGVPSFGAATAKKLTAHDRQAIVNAISERNPGPKLGEVVKKCESCGADIDVPLNLALLFRL